MTDANIFQALVSLDLNTKAVHRNCLQGESSVGQCDKINMILWIGREDDLFPGAISTTNVVFLKVKGLEFDVKHIKVSLQQFHDLKGVAYDCHQSKNPKKDPEDNHGMVGWSNVG